MWRMFAIMFIVMLYVETRGRGRYKNRWSRCSFPSQSLESSYIIFCNVNNHTGCNVYFCFVPSCRTLFCSVIINIELFEPTKIDIWIVSFLRIRTFDMINECNNYNSVSGLVLFSLLASAHTIVRCIVISLWPVPAGCNSTHEEQNVERCYRFRRNYTFWKNMKWVQQK